MSVIDDYLASIDGPAHDVMQHMYAVVRQTYPDLEEGLSYAMPAFLYKGKGLLAIMANKKFLSVYPYSGQVVTALAQDLTDFECTTGSIHFSPQQPISDQLLKKILTTRFAELDRK